MTTNITPACAWCGEQDISGLATVTAIAIDGEDGVDMRAAARKGIAYTGPIAEDMTGAAELLGEPTFSDDTTAVWADNADPNMVLRDLADVWHKTREAERIAAAAAYVAIRYAAAEGMTEVAIARLLDVDRMTVRRALGKR